MTKTYSIAVGLSVLLDGNLDEARAIGSKSNALSDDLVGVDQVGEDSIMHGSQGAGSWSLLLELTRAAGLLANDASLD